MPPARQIDVYLLPDLVDPVDLEGTTVVVIDVLRATTTIVHALAAGANEVAPCEEIDDAKKLAASPELPLPDQANPDDRRFDLVCHVASRADSR